MNSTSQFWLDELRTSKSMNIVFNRVDIKPMGPLLYTDKNVMRYIHLYCHQKVGILSAVFVHYVNKRGRFEEITRCH